MLHEVLGFSRGALCRKLNRGETGLWDFFSTCVALKKSGFVVWACEEFTSVYRLRFTSTIVTDLSIWFLCNLK